MTSGLIIKGGLKIEGCKIEGLLYVVLLWLGSGLYSEVVSG